MECGCRKEVINTSQGPLAHLQELVLKHHLPLSPIIYSHRTARGIPLNVRQLSALLRSEASYGSSQRKS